MAIYNIDRDNLVHIKQTSFKNEKELQNLTEKNLEQLFNLKFIASEFQVADLRIDTLAFNEETKSFVIIEYKNVKNYGVIDQGYSYLSLLLNRKADFVHKFNIVFNEHFDIGDFDYSQTRVMFIAPNYTTYQQKAIGFKDIAFELWKVVKYSNGTVSYKKIINNQSNASINQISGTDKKKQFVNREIKKYTEDEYLNGKTSESIELYNNLKDHILSDFEDVEIEPMKKYIKFKVNDQTIVTLVVRKNDLKVQINSTQLDDPKNLTREIDYSGGEGVGKYIIIIENEKDFDYFSELFNQAYDEKI